MNIFKLHFPLYVRQFLPGRVLTINGGLACYNLNELGSCSFGFGHGGELGAALPDAHGGEEDGPKDDEDVAAVDVAGARFHALRVGFVVVDW